MSTIGGLYNNKDVRDFKGFRGISAIITPFSSYYIF